MIGTSEGVLSCYDEKTNAMQYCNITNTLRIYSPNGSYSNNPQYRPTLIAMKVWFLLTSLLHNLITNDDGNKSEGET